MLVEIRTPPTETAVGNNIVMTTTHQQQLFPILHCMVDQFKFQMGKHLNQLTSQGHDFINIRFLIKHQDMTTLWFDDNVVV